MNMNANARSTSAPAAGRGLSRRQFVSAAGIAALVAGSASALFATGCDAADAAPSDSQRDRRAAGSSPTDASASASASADASSGSPAILVAYFSATGRTENVANAIAEATDADVFELTPAEPYTSDDLNYNDDASRVCREHEDPAAHVELAATAPENLADYDVIFLGAPLWWGHLSWVVNDFVTANDLTGTVIIPFCTSASSSYGDNTAYLQELAGTGTWLEGARFSGSSSAEDVQAWLDTIDLGAAVAQAQQDAQAQPAGAPNADATDASDNSDSAASA